MNCSASVMNRASGAAAAGDGADSVAAPVMAATTRSEAPRGNQVSLVIEKVIFTGTTP